MQRGNRLKRRTALKSHGYSLKRTPFKIKIKVNPKDFTPEVIAQMQAEQKGLCLRCRCSSNLDPHHKKPRSALTAKDIKEFGPGAGRVNCIGLCRQCHSDTHLHLPGTHIYRTEMNQQIGENARPSL